MNMTKSFCKVNILDENVLSKPFEKPSKPKSIVQMVLDMIDKAPPSANLLLGIVSGWLAGCLSIKIGKTAAVGLGGGVILIQFANQYGFINVNWEKVKEATANAPECFDKIIIFIKKNTYYSAGFIGGIFFGIASA